MQCAAAWKAARSGSNETRFAIDDRLIGTELQDAIGAVTGKGIRPCWTETPVEKPAIAGVESHRGFAICDLAIVTEHFCYRIGP